MPVNLMPGHLKAFHDEVAKISAVRGVVRPFTAAYAAEKGVPNHARFVAKNLFSKKVMRKTAAELRAAHLLSSAAAGGALTLAGYHGARKAVKDYQLGRAVRKQQGR